MHIVLTTKFDIKKFSALFQTKNAFKSTVFQTEVTFIHMEEKISYLIPTESLIFPKMKLIKPYHSTDTNAAKRKPAFYSNWQCHCQNFRIYFCCF